MNGHQSITLIHTSTKNLEVEIYFLDAVSAKDKSRDELARYAENEVRSKLESLYPTPTTQELEPRS